MGRHSDNFVNFIIDSGMMFKESDVKSMVASQITQIQEAIDKGAKSIKTKVKLKPSVDMSYDPAEVKEWEKNAEAQLNASIEEFRKACDKANTDNLLKGLDEKISAQFEEFKEALTKKLQDMLSNITVSPAITMPEVDLSSTRQQLDKLKGELEDLEDEIKQVSFKVKGKNPVFKAGFDVKDFLGLDIDQQEKEIKDIAARVNKLIAEGSKIPASFQQRIMGIVALFKRGDLAADAGDVFKSLGFKLGNQTDTWIQQYEDAIDIVTQRIELKSGKLTQETVNTRRNLNDQIAQLEESIGERIPKGKKTTWNIQIRYNGIDQLHKKVETAINDINSGATPIPNIEVGFSANPKDISSAVHSAIDSINQAFKTNPIEIIDPTILAQNISSGIKNATDLYLSGAKAASVETSELQNLANASNLAAAGKISVAKANIAFQETVPPSVKKASEESKQLESLSTHIVGNEIATERHIGDVSDALEAMASRTEEESMSYEQKRIKNATLTAQRLLKLENPIEIVPDKEVERAERLVQLFSHTNAAREYLKNGDDAKVPKGKELLSFKSSYKIPNSSKNLAELMKNDPELAAEYEKILPFLSNKLIAKRGVDWAKEQFERAKDPSVKLKKQGILSLKESTLNSANDNLLYAKAMSNFASDEDISKARQSIEARISEAKEMDQAQKNARSILSDLDNLKSLRSQLSMSDISVADKDILQARINEILSRSDGKIRALDRDELVDTKFRLSSKLENLDKSGSEYSETKSEYDAVSKQLSELDSYIAGLRKVASTNYKAIASGLADKLKSLEGRTAGKYSNVSIGDLEGIRYGELSSLYKEDKAYGKELSELLTAYAEIRDSYRKRNEISRKIQEKEDEARNIEKKNPETAATIRASIEELKSEMPTVDMSSYNKAKNKALFSGLSDDDIEQIYMNVVKSKKTQDRLVGFYTSVAENSDFSLTGLDQDYINLIKQQQKDFYEDKVWEGQGGKPGQKTSPAKKQVQKYEFFAKAYGRIVKALSENGDDIDQTIEALTNSLQDINSSESAYKINMSVIDEDIERLNEELATLKKQKKNSKGADKNRINSQISAKQAMLTKRRQDKADLETNGIPNVPEYLKQSQSREIKAMIKILGFYADAEEVQEAKAEADAKAKSIRSQYEADIEAHNQGMLVRSPLFDRYRTGHISSINDYRTAVGYINNGSISRTKLSQQEWLWKNRTSVERFDNLGIYEEISRIISSVLSGESKDDVSQSKKEIAELNKKVRLFQTDKGGNLKKDFSFSGANETVNKVIEDIKNFAQSMSPEAMQMLRDLIPNIGEFKTQLNRARSSFNHIMTNVENVDKDITQVYQIVEQYKQAVTSGDANRANRLAQALIAVISRTKVADSAEYINSIMNARAEQKSSTVTQPTINDLGLKTIDDFKSKMNELESKQVELVQKRANAQSALLGELAKARDDAAKTVREAPEQIAKIKADLGKIDPTSTNIDDEVRAESLYRQLEFLMSLQRGEYSEESLTALNFAKSNKAKEALSQIKSADSQFSINAVLIEEVNRAITNYDSQTAEEERRTQEAAARLKDLLSISSKSNKYTPSRDFIKYIQEWVSQLREKQHANPKDFTGADGQNLDLLSSMLELINNGAEFDVAPKMSTSQREISEQIKESESSSNGRIAEASKELEEAKKKVTNAKRKLTTIKNKIAKIKSEEKKYETIIVDDVASMPSIDEDAIINERTFGYKQIKSIEDKISTLRNWFREKFHGAEDAILSIGDMSLTPEMRKNLGQIANGIGKTEYISDDTINFLSTIASKFSKDKSMYFGKLKEFQLGKTPSYEMSSSQRSAVQDVISLFENAASYTAAKNEKRRAEESNEALKKEEEKYIKSLEEYFLNQENPAKKRATAAFLLRGAHPEYAKEYEWDVVGKRQEKNVELKKSNLLTKSSVNPLLQREQGVAEQSLTTAEKELVQAQKRFDTELQLTNKLKSQLKTESHMADEREERRKLVERALKIEIAMLAKLAEPDESKRSDLILSLLTGKDVGDKKFKTVKSISSLIDKKVQSARQLYDSYSATPESNVQQRQAIQAAIFEKTGANSPETLKYLIDFMSSSALTGIMHSLQFGRKDKSLIDSLNISELATLEAVKTLGQDTVMGFQNGANGSFGGVYKTFEWLANIPIETIKRVLDIHSPSKIMYDLGFWTIEGFKKGVTDTSTGLELTGEQIREKIVNGFKGKKIKPEDLIEFYFSKNNQGTISTEIARQFKQYMEEQIGNSVGSYGSFKGPRRKFTTDDTNSKDVKNAIDAKDKYTPGQMMLEHQYAIIANSGNAPKGTQDGDEFSAVDENGNQIKTKIRRKGKKLIATEYKKMDFQRLIGRAVLAKTKLLELGQDPSGSTEQQRLRLEEELNQIEHSAQAFEEQISPLVNDQASGTHFTVEEFNKRVEEGFRVEREKYSSKLDKRIGVFKKRLDAQMSKAYLNTDSIINFNEIETEYDDISDQLDRLIGTTPNYEQLEAAKNAIERFKQLIKRKISGSNLTENQLASKKNPWTQVSLLAESLKTTIEDAERNGVTISADDKEILKSLYKIMETHPNDDKTISDAYYKASDLKKAIKNRIATRKTVQRSLQGDYRSVLQSEYDYRFNENPAMEDALEKRFRALKKSYNTRRESYKGKTGLDFDESEIFKEFNEKYRLKLQSLIASIMEKSDGALQSNSKYLSIIDEFKNTTDYTKFSDENITELINLDDNAKVFKKLRDDLVKANSLTDQKVPLFSTLVNEYAGELTKLVQNFSSKDGQESLKNLSGLVHNLLTNNGFNAKRGQWSSVMSVSGDGSMPDNDALANALKTYLEGKGYTDVQISDYTKDSKELNATFKDQADHLLTLKARYNDVGRTMEISGGQIKRNTSFIRAMGATLQETFSRFSYYLSFASLVRKVFQEIKQGIATLKMFDASLTTISYTMDVSKQQLNDIGKNALVLADDLSTSIDNMMSIYQIYANMNTTAQEIADVATPTAILSNLSSVDASTASDQIQGVIQQFSMLKDQGMSAADASMHIVDVFNDISANVAIDYAKGIKVISDAVSASGQVAYDAGMSFETLAAVSAKVAERTREDGSSIGNAIKTILTRISRVSKMPEYIGEVDNGQLSNASSSLHQIGVEVYDAAGNFRNITDILTELNEKWDDLNDAQRANISFNIAATRQSSKFRAILESWADAQDLATKATESSGSALAKQEIYEDSINGKLQKLDTEWKEYWLKVVQGDSYKSLIEFLTKITTALNKLADNGHEFYPILLALVTAFGVISRIKAAGGIIKFTASLGEGISKLPKFIAGLKNLKTAEEEVNVATTASASKIGLIISAIAIVVSLIASLIGKTKEVISAADELQKIEDEIADINSKLKENLNLIEQINSKAHITFIDQQEIEELKTANQELESLLDKKQEAQNYKILDAAEEAISTYDETYPNKSGSMFTSARDLFTVKTEELYFRNKLKTGDVTSEDLLNNQTAIEDVILSTTFNDQNAIRNAYTAIQYALTKAQDENEKGILESELAVARKQAVALRDTYIDLRENIESAYKIIDNNPITDQQKLIYGRYNSLTQDISKLDRLLNPEETLREQLNAIVSSIDSSIINRISDRYKTGTTIQDLIDEFDVTELATDFIDAETIVEEILNSIKEVDHGEISTSIAQWFKFSTGISDGSKSYLVSELLDAYESGISQFNEIITKARGSNESIDISDIIKITSDSDSIFQKIGMKSLEEYGNRIFNGKPLQELAENEIETLISYYTRIAESKIIDATEAQDSLSENDIDIVTNMLNRMKTSALGGSNDISKLNASLDELKNYIDGVVSSENLSFEAVTDLINSYPELEDAIKINDDGTYSILDDSLIDVYNSLVGTTNAAIANSVAMAKSAMETDALALSNARLALSILESKRAMSTDEITSSKEYLDYIDAAKQYNQSLAVYNSLVEEMQSEFRKEIDKESDINYFDQWEQAISNIEDKISDVETKYENITSPEKLENKYAELSPLLSNASRAYANQAQYYAEDYESYLKSHNLLSYRDLIETASPDGNEIKEFASSNSKLYDDLTKAAEKFNNTRDAQNKAQESIQKEQANKIAAIENKIAKKENQLSATESQLSSESLSYNKQIKLLEKKRKEQDAIYNDNVALLKKQGASESALLKLDEEHARESEEINKQIQEATKALYDNKIARREAKIEKIQNTIDSNRSKATQKQYEKMQKLANEELSLTEERKKKLTEQLSGLSKTSEEWARISSEIEDCDKTIGDLVNKQKEWNKEVLQLDTEKLQVAFDQISQTVSEIEKQIEGYDSIIGGVNSIIDEAIYAEEQLKKPIQEQLGALQSTNDERSKSLALQKAQYELNKAMNQKTAKVYRSGQGWVYESDQDAIRNAQETYDNAQYDWTVHQLQKQISAHDEIIQHLNDQKDLWGRISESAERAANAAYAINAGLSIEDILSGIATESDLYNEIMGQYSSLFTEKINLSDAISEFDAYKSQVESIVSLYDYGIITLDAAQAKVQLLTSGFMMNEQVMSLLNQESGDVILTVDDMVSEILDKYGLVASETGTEGEELTNEWSSICENIGEVLQTFYDVTLSALADQMVGKMTSVTSAIQSAISSAKSALEEVSSSAYTVSVADGSGSSKKSKNQKAAKKHEGLATGIIGSGTLSGDDKLKIMGLKKLAPDEVMGLLRIGEAVLTKQQQENAVGNFMNAYRAGLMSAPTVASAIPNGVTINVSFPGTMTFNQVQDIDAYMQTLAAKTRGAFLQGFSK